MISDLDRRLIVVSNRAPYSFRKVGDNINPTKSIGGLVTALEPAIISRRGAWIAWEPSARAKKLTESIDLPPGKPEYKFYPVILTADEVSQYYHGFSNSVLWPLAHYFTGNLDIQIPERRAYARVNNRIANAVVNIGSPDDFFWIQDYQLGLVPGGIRQHLPDARIGFFWHIPFPSRDVFTILPGARGFLEGMLGSDRIGFHVPIYVNNFLECVQELTSHEVDFDAGIIDYKGREVQVGAWPISVDYKAITKRAGMVSIKRKAETIKNNLAADRIILGVDRLDYTKGILERLYAIDQFFMRRPEFRGEVSFIQVAAPSRSQVGSYRDLKAKIERVVGEINGKFAQFGWTPVQYYYKGFGFDEILQLYLIADVALITPLIDGMNLVAKEYVTARIDNTGVLVLSRRTGAARDLLEAIPVNPYDIEGMVEGITQALKMPVEEQQERMKALRNRVKTWDIYKWVEGFLSGQPAAFGQ